MFELAAILVLGLLIAGLVLSLTSLSQDTQEYRERLDSQYRLADAQIAALERLLVGAPIKRWKSVD